MTSDDGGRRPGSGGASPKERRRPRGDTPAVDDAAGSKPLEVRSLKGSAYSIVGYDSKGNPILEWRTELPVRREDDDTMNYLKALDADALQLAADDEDAAKPAREERGYNPYDKPPK